MNKRRSIRLRNWDYSSQGGYFVTLCTHNRDPIFGEIVKGKIKLNDNGYVIDKLWNKLTNRFQNIDLDIYQIMPNHFHAILIINNLSTKIGVINHAPTNKINSQSVGAQFIAPNNKSPVTLGQIVRSFKAKSSFELHKMGLNQIIWQRNFYEHIIRDKQELDKIRRYIELNPIKWDIDKDNPNNF